MSTFGSMFGMTPEQTIALSSVIVAGLAVVGTITNGVFDRRARNKEARTARSQDRLERTYLELLGYAHRQRMQANAIRPFMTYPAQPKPEPVTQEEIARVRSLVSAIASVKVRVIVDEFGDVLESIRSADLAITGIDEATSQGRMNPTDWGGTASDFHKRIDADKHRLVATEDRLHKQVRLELRQ